MTLAFNITLLLLLQGYLFYLSKLNLKIIFVFGLLVFQGLTIVPSLIYIEEGIYISEQGRDSYFVGATLIYFIYFAITLKLIFSTFASLKKYKATNPILTLKGIKYDTSVIFYLSVLALTILYYNALQSELPLFNPEITRFTYWENSKFPFLNKILGNTSIFIPFACGILFKFHRARSIFLLILYFIYNFLIGQKFSPIVSGLYSFFLPIILMNSNEINIYKLLNKKVLAFLIIIFVIAYNVVYKRYEERRPFAIIKIYDPNEAMIYRAFGLQGHLMWGSVEAYIYNDEPHSYNPSDFFQGMKKLMIKFAANKSEIINNPSSNFNFTNGYPSILFYVFPLPIAIVLHIILTIILIAFPGWLLFQFIKNGAYAVALVLYQFFNWSIYAFTMGYFYKLKFIAAFLICYAVFVVYKNKIQADKTNYILPK